MEFRSEKRLLQELKPLSSKLLLIWADAYHYSITHLKKDMVTTCIFRSDEEQHKICEKMGVAYYPSPHSDYRGIDVVLVDGKVSDYKDIEKYINEKYKYRLNDRRQTCLYHMGTALHLHFQVPPGTA